MKNYLLFLSLLFVGCATAQNPASKPTAAQAAPPAFKSVQGKLIASEVLQQIYPNGLPTGAVLASDGILSHAKIFTGGQSYNLLVYFPGKEDLVIEQITGCQPECSQKFKAHYFEAGKLKRTVRFETLYPKKQVDNFQLSFRSLLPNVKFTNDLVDWFRLPKKGTTIEVLVLSKPPGSMALKKSTIYRTGRLEWDGAKFKFKELDGSKPIAMKLTEVD